MSNRLTAHFGSPDLTDYYAARYADVSRDVPTCGCTHPTIGRSYARQVTCARCDLFISRKRLEEMGQGS